MAAYVWQRAGKRLRLDIADVPYRSLARRPAAFSTSGPSRLAPLDTSASSAQAATAPDKDVWVPPFLPRPLGVAEPPSSHELSFSERRRQAANPEHNRDVRKVLCVEPLS